MAKPDRYERMVKKEYESWLKGQQCDGWISIPLELLRREHAWMVRMVKRYCDYQSEQPTYDVCVAILDQLKKRKK